MLKKQARSVTPPNSVNRVAAKISGQTRQSGGPDDEHPVRSQCFDRRLTLFVVGGSSETQNEPKSLVGEQRRLADQLDDRLARDAIETLHFERKLVVNVDQIAPKVDS